MSGPNRNRWRVLTAVGGCVAVLPLLFLVGGCGSDDVWPKDHKGPSDPQAAKGAPASSKGGKTYGGVDLEGHSRDELYQRAKKLGVKGASRMRKSELAEAIAKKQ